MTEVEAEDAVLLAKKDEGAGKKKRLAEDRAKGIKQPRKKRVKPNEAPPASFSATNAIPALPVPASHVGDASGDSEDGEWSSWDNNATQDWNEDAGQDFEQYMD